ncbi:MAG: SIMPL domain-containing protein [Chloroflexota bacterium]
MRSKTIFLLSGLILASVLTACGATSSMTEPRPPQRVMTVTGAGQVTLTPDIAYVYIGVRTEDENVGRAVPDNNRKAQAVMDALERAGVATKDIRTTNFNVWPSDQYDEKGGKTGTIYVVENTVYVTVRDLTKLGELLETAIQSGANNINGVQFDVAERTEAIAKARIAAVEDARKQAEEIASAAGVQLGAVQTISYYDAAPMAYDYGKGGGVRVEAAVPVSPGQMQITTTVTIVYELK